MSPLIRSVGLRRGGAFTPPAFTPAEWTLNENSPVISGGTFGFASIVHHDGTLYAFVHGTDNHIDLYTSVDGLAWTHQGEVLTDSQPWEGNRVGVPQAWKEDGTWFMLYRGGTPEDDETGLATASAPEGPWTKHAGNPVLRQGGTGAWDARGAESTSPIKVGDTYYLYYESVAQTGNLNTRRVGVATSLDLTTWVKDARNPVFEHDNGGVFCPFVWRFSGLYYMLLPRYTNVASSPTEGVLDLYRSPRPTFYPEEREYLGTIWESTGELPAVPDVPWIVHADITNRERVQSGLKVYFATGVATHDGLYLLEHPDVEEALDLLEGVAFMHASDTDWSGGTLTDAESLAHNIVLEVNDATLVDQSVNAATGSTIGTNANSAVGNTFTTTGAMRGVTIQALVNIAAAPNGRLKCRVYATSGGLPTGSPLATAYVRHTASGYARFDFPDLELAAATQYAYVVGPELAEGANCYAMRGDGGANTYAGGTYVFWDTSLNKWGKNDLWDATFKVSHYAATGGSGSGTFESAELDLSPAGTASGVTRIRWAATTDAETDVTMEVALSTDGGATYGGWQAVTNGGSIPGISASADLTNYRLKYRATLTSSDAAKSPRLERVLIEVQGS